MGLFSKKKQDDPRFAQWNELLTIALTFNEQTGTWTELPGGVPEEIADQVIIARKMLFEYIRQLKEVGVYSNGAVHKFAKEQYPWVNKDNVNLAIQLGQYL